MALEVIDASPFPMESTLPRTVQSYHYHHSSPPTQLPLSNELYESIFLYLSPRDLLSASTVCRGARHEAQRLLFRSVDFSTYRNLGTHISAFCSAVSASSRLAAYVRVLSLPSGLPATTTLCAKKTAEIDPQFQILFPFALSALSKLSELHIWRVDNHVLPLLPWILEVCAAFRLRALHVEMPRGDLTLCRALDEFTQQQPELREWAMGFCFGNDESAHDEVALSPAALPCLSTVHVRRWSTLASLAPRPIERMHLCARGMDLAEHVAHDMATCPQVYDKLRHLRFEVGPVQYVSRWNKAPERLRAIAEQAPNLKTLGFFNDDVLYGYNVGDLVTALSSFKHLETFAMDPAEECIPTRVSSPSFDSRKACLEFAQKAMAACPSLQCIAFPVESYVKRGWGEHGQHVGLQRGQCPRFVRGAGGEVRLGGFDDIEQLRDYWKLCD